MITGNRKALILLNMRLRWPLLSISALTLVGLSGCRQKAAKASAPPPAPVTLARVRIANVPQQLRAIGMVTAFSTVEVKALVSGELVSADFHQGDYVRRGQTLFAIDSRPFQAALAMAEANLAKDEASYAAAAEEARRYGQLARQGVVSREQNEQMQAAARALNASIAADRAAVRSAKLNLSYCTIASPVEGRTGVLLVKPGNVIQANSTVLVTINQIEPIYVSFSVPQQYLGQLRDLARRQNLPVQVWPQNDRRASVGRLTFVDNAVDNSTGTIRLMATFPNANRRLWPGEYVNAAVTLSVASGAQVVPAAAVLTGQNGPYVYIATPQGTAENRNVTTGVTSGGLTVIQQGLRPGEMVVTDGQIGLYPGAKIKVTPTPAASSAAASRAQPAHLHVE